MSDYAKETDARHAEIVARLQAITKGCRPDMHEPDEQDLKARVVGYALDNAMGSAVDVTALQRGFQEFVVILERFFEGRPKGHGLMLEAFNLADLLAIARRAAIPSAGAREAGDLALHALEILLSGVVFNDEGIKEVNLQTLHTAVTLGHDALIAAGSAAPA